MNILAISCSPNEEGNTAALLRQVLEGARAEGSDTDLFTVAGKTIEPCRGCWACRETGECVIEDDMQDLYGKMAGADGLVIGAPIYLYGMSAQCKTVLDRTVALSTPAKSHLANKVGAAVVVAGSLGLIDALKDIYFLYVTRQMVPANYVAAYAVAPGEVKSLEKCMKAAFDLGRQMVLIARKKFEYPLEIDRPRIGFGTHTR